VISSKFQNRPSWLKRSRVHALTMTSWASW